MRLLSLFSAFAVSLAAVITSDDATRPSSILDLSAKDFKDTVAKGYWFVKHHSPNCGHCKALAPYWEKAGAKYGGLAKSHDFHLASVNCLVDGDLCSEHGVRQYPSLFLYKDGVQIDEYLNMHSDDPLVPLSAFIDKHSGAATPSKEVVTSSMLVSQSKATKVSDEPSFIKSPSEKGSTKQASGAADAVKSAAVKAEDIVKATLTEPKTANPLTVNDFTADKQQSFQNPTGTSVELTPDTFTKLVTNTQNNWFIKFYAPWCGHCKAMAPAWTELANDFQGKMNIGEVNCEAESRLCKDIGIRGYPTLMFFQGEEHTEYKGLRGLGDLMAFATKAVGSGIKDVDAAAFAAIQKKEEVIFLYFYDSATTSEDFEALQPLSLELIGHGPLVKTSSSILASKFRATTFPKLTVIRDGRPQYYNALGPADMRDHNKILAWMKTAWLPIVPELSPENSHEIMQNRIVVLAALDPESSQFEAQRSLLKEAAHEYTDQKAAEEQAEKQAQRDKKQTKIEDAEKKGDTRAVENAKGIQVKVSEHQEVGFAWVNGKFWEKWLAAAYSIDVTNEGAKIIINDEDRQRYWDLDSHGHPIAITKAAILDTLSVVSTNPSKISPKSTKNSIEAVYYAAWRAGTGHPYIMSCLGVGLLASILLILTRRPKKHPHGTLGVSDRERGPFLGGGDNGKFD